MTVTVIHIKLLLLQELFSWVELLKEMWGRDTDFLLLRIQFSELLKPLTRVCFFNFSILFFYSFC